MGRCVLDDEGLTAREHLLDLGILGEVDGEIAELLVVGRGDDVANVLLLAHEDDRDAIDLRDLGDALDDREEDAAKIEVRRERLRELEDDARVLLLAGERIHRGTQAELASHASDELDRLEGLSDEVVGAGLERLGDLVLTVERGEDDHRQIAGLGTRTEDAEDLVAIRRGHHEVEQDDRGMQLLDLRESLGARSHGDMLELCARKRLPEDMATHHVIVDDQYGPAVHMGKSIGPRRPQAMDSPDT